MVKEPLKLKMGKYNLSFKSFGENALLIEWPPTIDEDILHDLINFQVLLEKSLTVEIKEFLPAYQSLTLFFDTKITNCRILQLEVKELYKNLTSTTAFQPKIWHIPVCYDASFGIDQELIASYNNISIQEVIAYHHTTLYTIYFIGFLPGFLYLGGLHPSIHTPRKSTPRQKVIKGSVAIGGSQTGIYPQENPGGWNIIGNSPIPFLNLLNDPPVFSRAGDKVKFIPVTRNEYNIIVKEIEANKYELAYESFKG